MRGSNSDNDNILDIEFIKDGNVFSGGFWQWKNGDIGSSISLASQIGCVVGCDFCSVPNLIHNFTFSEIREKIIMILGLAEKEGLYYGENNLKVSFARDGDLILNKNLESIILGIREQFSEITRIKISTPFVDNTRSYRNLERSIYLSGELVGDGVFVQPQISIISTNEEKRQSSTRARLANYAEIMNWGLEWKNRVTERGGRKPNLTFTISDEDINSGFCNPLDLIKVLPSDLFNVRIRGILDGSKNLLSLNGKNYMISTFQNYGYHVIDGDASPNEIINQTDVGTKYSKVVY